MQRSSVRPSVRPSVCLSVPSFDSSSGGFAVERPVGRIYCWRAAGALRAPYSGRQQQRRAAGLLSSAVWAGYIAGAVLRAPAVLRAARRRCSAANASGVMSTADGVGWLDTDGSNEADYTQSCAHTRGIGQTVTARSANTTEACDAERRLAKCRRTVGI